MAGRERAMLLDRQVRFMHHLEKSGQLDRAIEYLPTDEELAQRKASGEGLTSPSLRCCWPTARCGCPNSWSIRRCPKTRGWRRPCRATFRRCCASASPRYITRHPLKREIIATQVLNSVVNRVGASFVHRMTEVSGALPSQIVRGYLAMREVFGHEALWQQIEALDNQVADAVQSAMLIDAARPDRPRHQLVPALRRLAEPMQRLIARCACRGGAARAPGTCRRRRRAPAAGRRPACRRQLAQSVASGGPVRRAGHRRHRRADQRSRWPMSRSCTSAWAAAGPAALAATDRHSAGRRLLGQSGQDCAQRRPGRAATRDRAGGAGQASAAGAVLASGKRSNRLELERAQRLLAELADAQAPTWRCCRWAAQAAQPGSDRSRAVLGRGPPNF